MTLNLLSKSLFEKEKIKKTPVKQETKTANTEVQGSSLRDQFPNASETEVVLAERFKTLTKTLPLKYENIYPKQKYLLDSKNPPNVKIEFYKNKLVMEQVKGKSFKWLSMAFHFETRLVFFQTFNDCLH